MSHNGPGDGVRGPMPSSLQLQTAEPTCTCFTALGDEGAQGLAHSDPQVWALTDGCAQCPRQPFEGGGHVCRPRAEPRQEGPDLGREGTVKESDTQQPAPLHCPTHIPPTDPLPATAACHRSWTPPCCPPGPGPLLGCDTRTQYDPEHPPGHQDPFSSKPEARIWVISASTID